MRAAELPNGRAPPLYGRASPLYGRASPLRETDAQAVLAARAFEEADPEGRLLPAAERERATLKAHEGGVHPGGEAEFLARRAEVLLDALEPKVPWLRGVLRGTRLGAGAWPLVLGVAFLIGLLSNALGPEKHVEVLKLPLFGLIAWNLCVYVFVIGFELLPRVFRRAPRGDAAERRARKARDGIPARFLSWFVERVWARVRRRRVRDAETAGAALAAYGAAWRRTTAPLASARGALLFHLGAAALALGIVLGMYARGIGFEYRATWQSTFLGPSAARRLLRFFLGPAAAVLGEEIPSLEGIRSPEEGDAAIWIHLYAFSALIFIVAPRALLATVEALRCRRLASTLAVDLDAGYFRRLLARDEGKAVRVEILPYAYRPAPRAADALKSLLLDVFGNRAEVVARDALEYGAEAADVTPPPGSAASAAGGAGGAPHRVVLFGLGATPEAEVHGRFLAETRERLRAGQSLLVVVDTSPYRERVGVSERVEERRRTWDRAAKEAGLEAVHVDLGQPPADDVLARLSRARAHGTDAAAGGGA